MQKICSTRFRHLLQLLAWIPYPSVIDYMYSEECGMLWKYGLNADQLANSTINCMRSDTLNIAIRYIHMDNTTCYCKAETT